ncbi:MAG: TRAP transporter large permease subunit, partial [Gammaproteobacteria bacterium]|nr:TRAP transporter large permease subunit [Gammaproteobacteria bacterium]
MAVAILFLLVIGMLLIGVPIAISLGLSSILFLVVHGDGSLSSIAQTLFSAFHGHFTLLAIPFFILASTFMTTGGVARRIIRFAIAVVGHFQGGLAIASVFACMMFAALSGSSPATVVAIGSIVIAGMVKVGYRKEFAAGVICNAGTLGILIPPSIVMVVYAAAVEVSVGRMFLAGVFPGLLAGLMLMLGIFVAAKMRGLPSQPWQGWGEVIASARDAVWGLLLIIIILGGIYGGIFTPTEAAAVSAVYAFVIANFVYRDMGPFKERGPGGAMLVLRVVSVLWHPDTKRTLFDAGKLTIMLLFIIANALILKHVLTEERVPQMITEAMLSAGFGPIVFLIVVNVILLIGGQFMEPSGLLVIVAPLVFPIAISLGIDPIHLGIIMVVNMEIGMITPPVGLNLFVTAGVAKLSVTDTVKAALPWL